MKLRQLYDAETSTYTYLLWDEISKEAALIDTVDTQVPRDLQLVRELGLDLRYTLETHIHADHITGSGMLRKQRGTQVVVHANSGSDCADILVKDGDLIKLGQRQVLVTE